MSNPDLYKSKACPLISIATVGVVTPAPLVQGINATGVERRDPVSSDRDFQTCIGPHCMWFVPVSDDTGKLVDGACAIALFPTAINILSRVVGSAIPMPAAAVLPSSEGK